MKKILSILSALIILSSCSSSNTKGNTETLPPKNDIGSDTAVSSDIPDIGSEITTVEIQGNPPEEEEEYIPTYLPEGEEKLVYAVPKCWMYGIHPRTVDEINYYLRSLGKPYYIEFCELDNSERGELLNGLTERISGGLQTDIITVSGEYGDDIREFAKVGNALDLSDYMTDELYNSMPEVCWEYVSDVFGGIYCVSAYRWGYLSPCGYIVNKSLMEKYGLTEDDFKCDISGLKPILERVKQGEGEKFYPFSTSVYHGTYVMRDICTGIGIDRKSGEIQLLCDNEDYIKIIGEILDMQNADLMKPSYDYADYANFPEYLVLFSFLDTIANNAATYNYGDYIWVDFPEGRHYKSTNVGMMTMVNKESEHLENAVDFLQLIFTDRTLTDYLMYGVEGANYDLVDGRMVNLHRVGVMNQYYFGNSFLSTPTENEFSYKNERAWEIFSKLEEDVAHGFALDSTGIEELVSAVQNAVNSYEMSDCLRKGMTVDEYLDNLRTTLRKAGADELLSIVKEQYEQWKDDNK